MLAVLVLLNIDAFRIRFISRPFLRTYRRMLPSMSQTEKDALEAGTVWWDGELFTRRSGLGKAAVGDAAAAVRRRAGIHRRARAKSCAG